jgi:hypothetical protein
MVRIILCHIPLVQRFFIDRVRVGMVFLDTPSLGRAMNSVVVDPWFITSKTYPLGTGKGRERA